MVEDRLKRLGLENEFRFSSSVLHIKKSSFSLTTTLAAQFVGIRGSQELLELLSNVYPGWLIASSYMSPNAGGGGCGVSANAYSCAHGARINFGDLIIYLTFGCSHGHRGKMKKDIIFCFYKNWKWRKQNNREVRRLSDLLIKILWHCPFYLWFLIISNYIQLFSYNTITT